MKDDDVIVSKTDLKGRILYTNDIFRKISHFEEEELLGQPHQIIRHPDMPRCVFKLLWDKISAGEEVFAYIKNACKNEEFYWVFAHVTPSYDDAGEKVGYHSNRRKPDPEALALVEILYERLLEIENSCANSKTGMMKAHDFLIGFLDGQGVSYDQFIFELTGKFTPASLEALLPQIKYAS